MHDENYHYLVHQYLNGCLCCRRKWFEGLQTVLCYV